MTSARPWEHFSAFVRRSELQRTACSGGGCCYSVSQCTHLLSEAWNASNGEWLMVDG